MAQITIVGLGPGSWTGLPLGSYQILETQQAAAGAIFLRTERHPVVDDLREKGIVFVALDSFYDEGEDFGQVYQNIANHLFEQAHQNGHIVYAVPGHPGVAEITVQNLRRQASAQNVQIVIGPGHSFLDDLLVKVGVDPTDGLLFLDGTSLFPRQVNPSLHTVIAQVYSRDVASDVKLTLMQQYPDDYPVTVARAIGVEGLERVETMPLYEIDRLDWIDHMTTVYLPATLAEAVINRQLWQFVDIIAALRHPETGCPWDLKQTHQTLRPYVLEEAFEVADAIDRDEPDDIADELGDLLLQIVLHAQVASEEGTFDIYEVIRSASEKMIRRHPHVFATAEAETAEDVVANWADIKAQERADKGEVDEHLLDSVPAALPGILMAHKLQKKAAAVGFDWDDLADVYDKVREEIAELEATDDPAGELGDLLFALVNLARFLKVDPEEALARTNRKFRERFAYIEDALRAQGKTPSESTLVEMDNLWNAAKKQERS
ncbi:nucleoside triphosphate pyrophosphohydrolase [Tumebacillus permanentifrigoris]|uniref:Tetrapyrrole methylase family protein/MazG family protein n=1 Tax=Tumebacillus permanentifrigoris TaxID=378543 RepID=A0A316D4Y4_9BACL|nr:nucleoside triphosphate pyrophosphohydrolase [Tumebacillus permanentifrigoris]PWK07873.1 tetrapyrrole methylase family protein/MazG family protein [Tumebacillus permanentifrigoris]